MENPPVPAPSGGQEISSLEKMTHIIYALQAGGLLVGFSLVAAVIVNYIKQDDVQGTWLASHFRWQIRTFWFTLLWAVLGGVTFVFVIGYFILVADGIWLVYRIAKGWIFLNEKKQMYASSSERVK
jgi:uncharacterized membrane protein